MEFLTRVLSGNSRLKERAREAEPVNQAFKENLDNLKRLLESEERDDISAVLDKVYETSFPEEQVFMKTPSRARLKFKKELVVRLLIGLDYLGVPAMAEMLVFVRKHGPEGVADSLMTLLEFMSPLLAGKKAPVFSTDDVVDAMDFEWHSTSRTGSPLLNVIASVTSSPRASTASVGDSPLYRSISASPYRRPFPKRLMLVSQANDLDAKSVLDKTSTASTPPQKMMTANQGFRPSELTILEKKGESHVVASTSKECGGSKEASMVCEEANSKLDQDKQYGLECPMMVEDALQGGEVSKPNSWEASEDVDSHPLCDKDHIHCQSLAQILDASSAVQSTESGHTDQLAVQFTDCGTQCELLTQVVDGRQFTDSGMHCELLTQVVDARQFTDSGMQCELLTQVVDASESQPLHDVNHHIEGPAVYIIELYARSPSHKSASQSTMSGTAAKSTDTEPELQFPGSGMHHAPTTQVANASESQPLHEDDYIQRPPAQFTEPYAAAVHDHEHQNADHLSHVFPVSNKTDPPYAPLPHGQPTFSSISGDGESQQRSNQQPATMDRWDSDTKVPRYKGKGNFMEKMKCGYLSCCTRPPTNS